MEFKGGGQLMIEGTKSYFQINDSDDELKACSVSVCANKASVSRRFFKNQNLIKQRK